MDFWCIYHLLCHFLIPPTLSPSTVQCVPHPPEICITNPHFHLIYQGVLQRIFGMFSVKIRSFLTMLRCFCLLSRHLLIYVFSFSISFYFYNFEYTPASQKGHSSSATPALGRLAVFNRKGGVTGASSLADCSAFIYKRHFCRLLTWFVVFPEAFLAFAAQVSGAV